MNAQAATSPQLDYFFSLEHFGIKLGLDNIEALMGLSGNPHLQIPVVHVAGTNGKGSVIAFLDTIFSIAGYRTGRFTSPHLINVNERFLVERKVITDEALNGHITYYKDLCESHGLSPTFFELATAIAFRHFAHEKVDVVLLEVGMGGRLDSTNIVSPVLSVITNIDFDHTEHLGDTLAKIAGEKAGIIKAGVPVVCGVMQAEALEVISKRADELNAPLHRVPTGNPDECVLGMQGTHQKHNAAIAVRCVELLRDKFDRLDEKSVRLGLKSTRWPCRLEQVSDNPPIILDVAHNVAGALQLRNAIEHCVCVLAVSADKDAKAMIDALAPCVNLFLLSTYQGNRAMSVEKLSRFAEHYAHESFDTLAEAITHGIALASNDLPLLITGSIFTVGEARKLLMEMGKAKPIRFI